MNRRDFLQNATRGAMSVSLAAGAVELRAYPDAVKKDDPPKTPAVPCAVIGASYQGQAILTSLAKLGVVSAPVVAVCDTFSSPNFTKRATGIAPAAKVLTDYRHVLDDKSIQAVFIATPSHEHKQIALDAIAAGKHVYCEAPLATDLAEAKAIAQAGAAAKTVFQAGIQFRSNLQHQHVFGFVKSAAIGYVVGGRAQWHSRQSWRPTWPTADRQQELSWRTSKATSSGLMGEVGIHQVDIASWYLRALPLAVTGYGGIMEYHDGRDVADTVECVIEYPKNINFVYDATLSSSYDGAYEIFLGTGAAIQTRDQRAWMFKESDANDIGWETFARKDPMSIGNAANGTGIVTGVGIALVADASKQLALGKDPGKTGTDTTKTALYQAIDGFLDCCRGKAKVIAGPLEGYQATVIGNKCNEAVVTKSRIEFRPEWFTLS